MQWSPAPNAGFSPPDACWAVVAAGGRFRERNVERQLDDPASLLNLYRALLGYRRESAALQWGGYQAVDNVPDDCFVFLREAEDQRILVALNLSSQSRTLRLSD